MGMLLSCAIGVIIGFLISYFVRKHYTIGNLKNPLSQNHLYHILGYFSCLRKASALGVYTSSETTSLDNYKVCNSKYPL